MNQHSKATPKACWAEWHLLLVALGLGFAFWPSSDRTSVTQAVQEETRERDAVELVSRGRGLDERQAPLGIGTMPIQSIAVGHRVLGEDPLIDDAERAQWTEPDWQHWLKLSLVMRKDTGDELQIELLRPEAWLMERWQFVADRPLGWCVLAPPRENDKASDNELSTLLTQCGPPWRTYRQQIAATTIELIAEGYELVGLTLALDLHEIGAAGEAIVTDIQPAPMVMPGNGRVVTGTFSHRSGDVIDLTLSDGSQEIERIGTTSNHPFWSEDRRDYVQAGSLEEGERVLTYSGDTKRVVSKLARPGPRPVYNLEVHGEHVYHVGNDGVLVHNQNGYTGAGDPSSAATEAHNAANFARYKQELTRLEAAQHGSGTIIARRPVAGATAAQEAQIREYVSIANLAEAEGYMSATGRVSTQGRLRAAASRAAAAERRRAAAAGTPYQGVVGHGPDTTWTGRPEAPFWIDMDNSINSSLGRQSLDYPLGIKPRRFIFEDDL